MSEDEAMKQILDQCHTDNFEMNGCNLDDIIKAFLESNGFFKLVAAIDGVECWRS